MYLRGKRLVDEALRVEKVAAELAQGWEAELRIAVEIIFPTWLLLETFALFSEEHPGTGIQLFESVLGDTSEALLQRQVELAIGPSIPPGFTGDALMQVHFVPAASPQHPLHALGRPLTSADLYDHRRLLVRESGSRHGREPGFVAEQRLTVSTKSTSIRAACMGLGFAWFPAESIQAELASGQLKQLPLTGGGDGFATLYLIHADPDSVQPGAKRLAEMLKDAVAAQCPQDALAH